MDQGTLAGAVHSGRLLAPLAHDAASEHERATEWVSGGGHDSFAGCWRLLLAACSRLPYAACWRRSRTTLQVSTSATEWMSWEALVCLPAAGACSLLRRLLLARSHQLSSPIPIRRLLHACSH